MPRRGLHTIRTLAVRRLIWVGTARPEVARNLRWYWLDGVFSQASEVILGSYFTLFVLALGASRGQIAALSSVTNLTVALPLLPGAALVERFGHRKRLCLWSGGYAGRLILIAMALLPALLQGPALVNAILVLAVLRAALSNLGSPAWTSLTADLIPAGLRGRFLSARNIAMGIVGMVMVYATGQFINRVGTPIGYQWAIAAAFALGMVATWGFSHIQEPPISHHTPAGQQETLVTAIREIRSSSLFLRFCGADALWNFSLNVAGPFFSVYLVEGLGATTTIVGTLSVINAVAAVPGQRLFGRLTDRWGPRRVQVLTGLLIPLLPLAWLVAPSAWHLVPVEVASGFLWAGYGLASFNTLLHVTPEARRPRYIAIYQIVVTASMALGAAVGGLIVTRWGDHAVFAVSGVGRFLAAVLFAVLVKLPRHVSQAEEN